MGAILVVDLAAVLDKSKVGAEARAGLEKLWKDAQGKSEADQRQVLAELERKRDALRTAVLARARPAAAELAKKKGAQAVLEKGSVVWAEGEDITAQVIARVDAGGPLKG